MQRFAAHLQTELPALLSFLFDPTVDATNWRAEHALRPAVVNRKVCGGNRSTRGANTQQVLTTVLRTAQQRQLDAAAVLSDLLCARQPTVSQASFLQPTAHPGNQLLYFYVAGFFQLPVCSYPPDLFFVISEFAQYEAWDVVVFAALAHTFSS